MVLSILTDMWWLVRQLLWLCVIGGALYFVFGRILQGFPNYTSELRSVVQELNRSKSSLSELTRALRLSKDELQECQLRLEKCSHDLDQKSIALETSVKELEVAQAEIDALRVRLAASEARREELVEAAEKASVARWELASRFTNDAEACAAALNDLRRPPQQFAVTTSEPLEDLSSESYFLPQRPDLSISDSEEDRTMAKGTLHEINLRRTSLSWEEALDDAEMQSPVNPGQLHSQESVLEHTSPSIPGENYILPALAERSFARNSGDTVLNSGIRRRARRQTDRALSMTKDARQQHRPKRSRRVQNIRAMDASKTNSVLLSTAEDQSTSITSSEHAITDLPEVSSVELQCAPWLISPEASEARRGLAMETLLQSNQDKLS